MKEERIYFANLDSIRFFAALMVFLQHGFSASYAFLNIKGTILEKILNLISTGGTGVSIFFVLSGFLITYLLVSEYELKSKINLKNFYIRRVLRIWPLYYAVVIFSFIVYPALKSVFAFNNPLGTNIFYHLTFLSNFDVLNVERYFPGKEALSQNITWSVSIEEQFYLFWPLIFTFLPSRFWIKSISLVIVTSITFRLLHYTDDLMLYFHTLSVLIDLAMGGLFALLVKYFTPIRTFFETCSTKTHFTLFVVSFILLFFNETIFDFKYGSAINRVFISCSFALIISAQALTKSNSILNLKNVSFASQIGKYTYGIYLIHPIVITLTDVTLRSLHFQKNTFLRSMEFGIICFILTLLLSKFSYDHFESKFLRLKDRFTTIESHE